jgi:NAD(P)-dependent dehydrogenase (short-subunit alcohol dehydrogenase family)
VNSQGRLAGKRALVTGSGTGIGREIALEFAREGADVVLHFAHSGGGAESAADEIRSLGRRSAVVHADFADLDAVAELGRQAIHFLGGVDCLVNNSGITLNRPFLDTTREQFDLLYNVNIRAQFFLTQQIVQDMLPRGGGAICNVTSVHALQGAPEHAVYAGTKGAIVSYTRALAVELAHRGIRVNAIAPGWVTVENYYKAIPGFQEDAAREAARNAVPVSRAGTPRDIARLAVFLCSDEAEFIVGQTLVADGGTTSLMSLFPNFRERSQNRFGTGYVPGI